MFWQGGQQELGGAFMGGSAYANISGQGGSESGQGPWTMQPAQSDLTSPFANETAKPPLRSLAGEPVATFRVDAPTESGNIISPPHHPISPVRPANPNSPRPASGRIRGERSPRQTPERVDKESLHSISGSENEKSVEAQTDSESMKSFAAVAEPPSAGEQTWEMDWRSAHAADISRILDQRFFELERRECLLNRRASQLSQQERMFRLWANDNRQEIERKRRELAHLESELMRRSDDLRWLLVHGEKFDSGELRGTSGGEEHDFRCTRGDQKNTIESRNHKSDESTIEDDLRTEVKAMEFEAKVDGVRRINL